MPDITVHCTNELCPWLGEAKTIPASIGIGEGEVILCGACGRPSEFLTAIRPRRIPFDPEKMNLTVLEPIDIAPEPGVQAPDMSSAESPEEGNQQ